MNFFFHVPRHRLPEEAIAQCAAGGAKGEKASRKWRDALGFSVSPYEAMCYLHRVAFIAPETLKDMDEAERNAAVLRLVCGYFYADDFLDSVILVSPYLLH